MYCVMCHMLYVTLIIKKERKKVELVEGSVVNTWATPFCSNLISRFIATPLGFG